MLIIAVHPEMDYRCSGQDVRVRHLLGPRREARGASRRVGDMAKDKRRQLEESRKKELERFYAEIGLGTEEVRRYMSSFGLPADGPKRAGRVQFIEAGTSSFGYGDIGSARLERDS